MDLGLAGKVAVITGGSEGIGRAAAHCLAREGARVVLCARRRDVLERTSGELAEATGADVLPVVADVMEPADVARLISTAVDRFGRLDALVNNAGTSRAARFESVTDDAWRDDLELKLFGAVRTTRLALPHLRRAGGSVVNVLNIGAKQPGAASVPTSVSRAAGMALTKALSKELAPDNVRVNAVLIGLIKSGQHERRWRDRGPNGGSLDAFYAAMAEERGVPLGRVGETEEAGSLIAFLCSTPAAYITGTAINLDGGLSHVV